MVLISVVFGTPLCLVLPLSSKGSLIPYTPFLLHILSNLLSNVLTLPPRRLTLSRLHSLVCSKVVFHIPRSARQRPSHVFHPLAGISGAALIDTLMPNLPLTCMQEYDVRSKYISVSQYSSNSKNSTKRLFTANKLAGVISHGSITREHINRYLGTA